MSLTDVKCRSVKPTDCDYSLADENGLCLLVKQTGSKWWRFNYRYGGKRKTLSMGVYPETTLKMAREKRDEARQMILSGIDPSSNRKAEKAAQTGEVQNSFKVITLEWLIKMKSEWAESHYSKIEARMKNDILPWLGNMPISEIKAMDILKTLQRIESRGAIETANRTRETIGQIYRYAIATGRAERNPAPDLIGALSRPKEKFPATRMRLNP